VGLGFRVWGVGFQASSLKVWGLEVRVQGTGFRILGCKGRESFMNWGLGFGVCVVGVESLGFEFRFF
jgi:hypothetical protein